MDLLDLLAVQGTLKSLLQHHPSKASILWCLVFFIQLFNPISLIQLSHPYMTTGKIIALTIWTFVDKVMSLLFNKLSRLVIIFLPRSKHLLISWLQSPSAVILHSQKIVCHSFHCSMYIILMFLAPCFIIQYFIHVCLFLILSFTQTNCLHGNNEILLRCSLLLSFSIFNCNISIMSHTLFIIVFYHFPHLLLCCA